MKKCNALVDYSSRNLNKALRELLNSKGTPIPSFAAILNRHLALYKTLRLGVEESGAFLHKGRIVKHGHILPKELLWLNILEPYRAEIRQYVQARDNLKLHRYFHHLNSSQAFALNLFFPFFENGHSAYLLQAMGFSGNAKDWYPEYIVAPDEGTNVDVAWRSAGNNWTYCEVKLSETQFGIATDDKRHKEKLELIYRPVLSNYCPAELLESQAFFAKYQYFETYGSLHVNRMRQLYSCFRGTTQHFGVLSKRSQRQYPPSLQDASTSSQLKTFSPRWHQREQPHHAWHGLLS